jgi:hypothetical protein
MTPVITCCHHLIPERYRDHPLVTRLVVRFAPMTGDLISCADPRTATIYLRIDAPLQKTHEAFRREFVGLIERFGCGGTRGSGGVARRGVSRSHLEGLALVTDERDEERADGVG